MRGGEDRRHVGRAIGAQQQEHRAQQGGITGAGGHELLARGALRGNPLGIEQQ